MGFALAFWHDNRNIIAIDENMNVLWNKFISTYSSYMYYSVVVDTFNNVLYHLSPEDNGNSCKIISRSLTTGNIINSSALIESNNLITWVVDSNGRLWTTETYQNDYAIKVWNSDLTLYKTYTLKAGNPLNNYVRGIALTYDMSYIYIVGGDSPYKIVAKYELDDLENNEPIWYKSLDDYTALWSVCVDEDDNVYVAAYTSAPYKIIKLLSATGEFAWTPNYIEGGNQVAYYNSRLYTETGYVSGVGDNKFKQFNAETGALIAESALCGSRSYGVAISSDKTTLFGGGDGYTVGMVCQNNTYIRNYSIEEDWASGETPIGSVHVDGSFYILCADHIWICSDPTGYINSLFILPVVATPEANPTSGNYSTALLVELSCSTTGADIYYTTDGSDPDESSTLYSESIEIFSDTTIKAKAYKAGYDPSDIVTLTYTVTITDFTIKARAFKSNLNPSNIVEFEYTKASLKDPTYQQVVTTIKDIQLVSFNKDTNIAFLEALPNEGYTTGFYLVIQKIVKRLLTDKGSSSFDSTFGSNLCRILGSSELQDDVILKTNLTIILKELVEAINLEFENLEDDDVEITDEMMLSSIIVNSLRFDTNTMKWIITLKIVTLANEVASIQLGVG